MTKVARKSPWRCPRMSTSKRPSVILRLLRGRRLTQRPRLFPQLSPYWSHRPWGSPVPEPLPGTLPTDPPGDSGEAPAGLAPPAVTFGDWVPCEESDIGDCREAVVPLDWAAREGEQIAVTMSRLTTSTDAPVRQIWVLPGGPGQSINALGTLVPRISGAMEGALDGPVEVMAAEHRGALLSEGLGQALTRLGFDFSGVPEDESEALDYLTQAATALDNEVGLQHYNTSNAARDLAALIASNRRPGVPVFVLGVSYGTRLTLRMLNLYPDLVDGVILDGLSVPGTWVNEDALHNDDVVRGIADVCADDAFCRVTMGEDPYDTVRSNLSSACPGFEDDKQENGDPRRDLFFNLLDVGPGPALAMSQMVARCQDADVVALNRAWGFSTPAKMPPWRRMKTRSM